ncbi:4-fold beta flower protein [Rhizobium rosettiformans]|uniref:4-fold beta flower domain-containing protein n=2 Tax=Rhizobium rosettiformans TaxID=1368430 RepID=A0A4S8PKA2_9HYPH|nr:hypothetical protein FAA86_22245 [Rhizobium rosettiformans W3]
MFALFNRNCELVGWIEPDEHIFDTDMNWVAYLSGGHGWSAATGNWLGPVDGLLCLDRSGRPVAWNPEERVEGTARPGRPSRAARAARPGRPARPARPSRPSRPATPAGGWSSETFSDWIGK